MDINGIDNLREKKESMSASLKENMDFLNRKLDIDKNFDLVYRVIQIGGKDACMYFVDGFCKDDAEDAAVFYGYHAGRASTNST